MVFLYRCALKRFGIFEFNRHFGADSRIINAGNGKFGDARLYRYYAGIISWLIIGYFRVLGSPFHALYRSVIWIYIYREAVGAAYRNSVPAAVEHIPALDLEHARNFDFYSFYSHLFSADGKFNLKAAILLERSRESIGSVSGWVDSHQIWIIVVRPKADV